MQLRLLQMEFLYGQAMRFRVKDILAKPINFFTAILRELDGVPTKIQRTIKILLAEIADRQAYIGHGENVEIDPIEDAPKLPGCPSGEVYYGVVSNQGDIPVKRLRQNKNRMETDSQAGVGLAKQIISDFAEKMEAEHGSSQPAPAEVKPE